MPVDSPVDSNERYERSDSVKLRIRPNNYAVLVALLGGSENLHLAFTKCTGHGVVKEYSYFPDVTIEKTRKSIIIYLKKRFIKVITKEEEIDKIDKDVRDFLAAKLLKFMEQYPQVQLDWTHAKLIRREIGVRDKTLRIHRNLRMKDDIFKKVYSKPELEFYNPAHLKLFVKNRAIEDWSPELAKRLDILVEQMIQFSKNLEMHLGVLQEMSNSLKKMNSYFERETFATKIGRFIKKLWEGHKKWTGKS